jgi:hypothetical protein
MGGIDTSDIMLYCYLGERKTVKHWKKVTFNIFGRMVLNSYILYKENSTRQGYNWDAIYNQYNKIFGTRRQGSNRS